MRSRCGPTLLILKMPPKKRTAEISRIEADLSSLSNQELREALKDVGEIAGPIDLSNRLAKIFYMPQG